MRADLAQIWRAGVAACHPARVLPPRLPEPPAGRVIVLALGKAAGPMAEIAEAHYGARTRGAAVMPHGTAARLDRIAPFHAGHPLPDEGSVAAAEWLLRHAGEAQADDLVLVLLSGGASALACLPGPGLTLEEKRAVSAALLGRGVRAAEIGCVRRHLSRFKGGRLAVAASAPLLTLAISDVEGDRPEDIGSGPTAPDATSIDDARAILAHHGVEEPARGWTETPNSVPGRFQVIARNADALAAAAQEARRLGYRPEIIGEFYDSAHATGTAHALQAMKARPGTALISGGEGSSPYSGPGMGGRNHVYALAAAARLAGAEKIAGLAADTDGLDGSAHAAGAFFDGNSRWRSGEDAVETLTYGLSGAYFAGLGDQFVTGPTGTNVNDLRIILVGH